MFSIEVGVREPKSKSLSIGFLGIGVLLERELSLGNIIKDTDELRSERAGDLVLGVLGQSAQNRITQFQATAMVLRDVDIARELCMAGG